jgi:hypothetical protein
MSFNQESLLLLSRASLNTSLVTRHFFILWLVILAAYLIALVGPFQFDDFNVIVHNDAVHSLSAWWQSWPGLRILLKLSYALNWQFFSQAPLHAFTPAFSFHLVNIFLHLLNASLLLLWLRALLPSAQYSAWSLLLATLLWALHPAQTEAVTYISGRSVSLMATFYMAALYIHTRRLKNYPLWTALFTLMALLIRESAWTLAPALLLIGHLQRKKWQELWQDTAPSFLVTAAIAVLFFLEPHYHAIIQSAVSRTAPGSLLLTQLAAWQHLFINTVIGLNPNIDPDLHIARALTPFLALSGVILIAVFFTGVFLFIKRSLTGFALLWFFLHMAPSNSFFLRSDIANDRHLYLALMGLALLLAITLSQQCWQRLPAVLLLLLFFATTFLRNADYQSELALWAHTTAQSPDKARPWINLGFAANEAGNTRLARQAYQRALTLAPDDKVARTNLYFLETDTHSALEIPLLSPTLPKRFIDNP